MANNPTRKPPATVASSPQGLENQIRQRASRSGRLVPRGRGDYGDEGSYRCRLITHVHPRQRKRLPRSRSGAFSEYEEGGAVCPDCGSKEVEQRLVGVATPLLPRKATERELPLIDACTILRALTPTRDRRTVVDIPHA